MLFGSKTKIKKAVAGVALWSVLSLAFAPSANALFKVFDIFKPESSVPRVARTRLISVLVEDDLLEDTELKNKIERYAIDVQKKIQGKSVLIPIPYGASPLDVYEGNAHLYFSGVESDGRSQLVGTVLIGNVPLPVVDKNGNLWPTIFPYTDFENPTYEWDLEQDRFVFRGGDHEPEIWHGVIRSDKEEGTGLQGEELREVQRDELVAYFNRNHAVHEGTETFAEKVFYADLPRQSEGLDAVLKEQYANFISHVEDIAYMRFNKTWATNLLNASSLSDAASTDFLSEAVAGNSTASPSEGVSNIPDIHTKTLIEGYAKRYFEAWRNYLASLNETITDAGRWGAEQIDTTISLISQKDETSALQLKQLNDRLESKLNTELGNKNIAENISVFKNTDHPLYSGELVLETTPLYTNGVNRDDLDVEDCTLLRGSFPNTTYPLAQVVEANRAYNFDTRDSCGSGYAGCCANSLRVSSGALNFSAPSCEPENATLPIFDIAGSHQVSSGALGAEGCSDIVITPSEGGNPDDEWNELSTITERFDSLFYHNEPTAATITAQLDAMGTQSLPVDDPRGFSFYDHGKTYQRVNYVNLFDLIGWNADLDDATRKELLEDEIRNRLTARITEINNITTTGNATSNARFQNDFGNSWPNGTPTSPPDGYGGYCTYTPSETTMDDNTDKLEWTENCDWWEGGIVDDPENPDQTSDPALMRIYETNEDNVYDEDALIADRAEEWPGDPFTIPGGYVGAPPTCEYTQTETILGTNTARLQWDAECEWSGVLPPDNTPGSGTLTGTVVRFYETTNALPSADDTWPGTGYDEACTYETENTSIDIVTTSIEWTETCPGPVVRTETHIFEDASYITEPFENQENWPGTPSGGACSYTSRLGRGLSGLDDFTTEVQWTETCIGVENTEQTMVRYYETGNSISEDIFDDILSGGFIEKAAEAIIWLDKPIETKNRLVFDTAFSSLSTARQFFLNNSFGDGYELVEIIGEKANSGRLNHDGVKMSFERGETADNSQFWDAKREAALFGFKTADDLSVEEEEAKMFSGIFAKEKNQCGVSVLEWFPCFIDWLTGLPEYFNQKISVQLPELPEISFPDFDKKPLIFSSDEKGVADTANSIRVSPDNIRVIASEINPVIVEVELLNNTGQFVKSDFSSEVSLEFSGSAANSFFDITPSSTVSAVGGKAVFTLLPKGNTVGGKFTLTAHTENISSDPVPVSVTQLALFPLVERKSIVAGNKEGLPIRIKVQDQDYRASLEKDGQALVASSDWGTFAENGRARIKNGEAILQFLPGIRAGTAHIQIVDEAEQLPPLEVEVSIVPDVPAKLSLFSEQKYLVPGSGFTPVDAELHDRFGNLLSNKEHTITWFPDNLEIRDAEKGSPLEQKVKGGSQIFVRPTVVLGEADIRATTDAIPLEVAEIEKKEDLSNNQKIPSVEKKGITPALLEGNIFAPSSDISEEQGKETLAPTSPSPEKRSVDTSSPSFSESVPEIKPVAIPLKRAVDIPEGASTLSFRVPEKSMLVLGEEDNVFQLEAGGKELLIPIRTETSWEEVIRGSFPISVLTEPVGIGVFPTFFTTEDGLARLRIIPGTRAGKIDVTLTSQGFENVSFEVEILPSDPQKILLSADRDTIDVDEEEEINVSIEVVDIFGNPTPEFTGKVYLVENEPEVFSDSDDDLMRELGVISGEADRRSAFLEQEAAGAHAELSGPDAQIVTIEDGGDIQMIEGRGTATILPKDQMGKVFLTARSPGLVPDALEFEVTKHLSIDDVANLSPKSLVTFLFGFEGGDQVRATNMGNRFLFSGRTQAVGTLVADSDPFARVGSVSPEGALSESLQLVFQYGDYTEPEIFSEGRLMARARILFSKNGEKEVLGLKEPVPVDFFVRQERDTEAGIYFIPAEEFTQSLERKERSIYFRSMPVLSVTDTGGIRAESGGVVLEPTEENSLFQWSVSVNGEAIGRIEIVPDTYEILEEKDEDRLEARIGGGVFLVRQSADILMETAFTGNSTLDGKGIAFVSSTEREEPSKMLGSPRVSAEEAGKADGVPWKGGWRAGTHFAAGNPIGQATMWGGSDAFILLGDPTVTIGSENTRSALQITPDIGTQLWKSPSGPIDQILVANMNGDPFPDIFSRVGNTLHALYQDDTETDNFRYTGPILRFSDGVQDVIAVDNDHDSFADLIQLNGAGKLVFHKNKNGIFEREPFEIENVISRITSIKKGNIDDDVYTDDLIFADEAKNLYVAFGTEDSAHFSPLYRIDNFAPYFERVEENFIVADEQGSDRKYTESEKFSNLNGFFVSFEGVEGTIGDTVPAHRVREVQNPDVDSEKDRRAESDFSDREDASSEEEDTPPDGESGPPEGEEDGGLEGVTLETDFIKIIVGGIETSFDALTQWLETLTDDEEAAGEDPLGTQMNALSKSVLTESGIESESLTMTFVSLPFNSQINAVLEVDQDVDTKMSLGEEITASLTLESSQSLENTQFAIPKFGGMTALSETFSCMEGCEKPILLRANTFPEAELWTEDFSLPARTPVTFTWKMKVTDFAPLQFMVFDFEGDDQIDDIAVPWVSDNGDKQFVEYVSYPPNRDIPRGEGKISSLWNNTKAALIGGYQDEHGRWIHSERSRITSNPATPDTPSLTADQVFSNDSDSDGLPDLYDTFGALNLNISCGGCGLPVPSISFLGPGSQSLYVPPFSLAIPSLLTLPVLQIIPSIPFVLRFSPVSGSSLFRLFIMPTTTAQVGISICVGPPLHNAKPAWTPNCFVFVVPVLSSLGLCPDDGSATPGHISEEDLEKIGTQFAKDEEGKSFLEADADWRKKLGLDKRFKLKLANKQIKPADIITTWWQEQKKELEQFKLPSISVLFPKLPKGVPLIGGEKNASFDYAKSLGLEGSVSVGTAGGFSDTEFEEVEAVEVTGTSDWEWVKSMEKYLREQWAELNSYPFITIRQKDYPIPVPVIPKAQWDKYSETWEEKWEPRYKALKETTWETFTQKVEEKWDEFTREEEREKFRKDFQVSCQQNNGFSQECADVLKQVDALADFVSSVEQNIAAWETNKNAYERNREVIKSYFNLPEDFKLFGDTLKNFKDEINNTIETVEQYLSEWKDEFDRHVKEWKRLGEIFDEYLDSWEELKKLFTDFWQQCPICAVNRGASIEWLSRIFLGGLKLPVIPVPKLPNIRFDFSNIDISLAGDGPVIIAEPVELALPDIPDIDLDLDFSLGINGKIAPLPILPVIPVLPPFPQFNFNLPVSVSLPELPNIISPPSIPNLLIPVISLIKTLKKLTKLLCYVVGGIAPVPEWYVAGYVQQLTNRTQLFGLDFSQPALSPVLATSLEFEDTQVILNARFGVPTGILEILNVTVATIQGVAECTVDKLGRMAKGDFSSDESCSPNVEVAREVTKSEPILAQNTLPTEELIWDFDDMQDVDVSSEQQKTIRSIRYETERLLAEFDTSDRITQKDTQGFFNQLASLLPSSNVFATLLSPGITQRWLTSVNPIDVSDIPVDMPEGLSQTEVSDSQKQYAQYTPAIYYYDAETGRVGAVTEFPLAEPMTYAFENIRGTDDTAELLYSSGNELFLKYRIVPTRDRGEQDALEDRYEDHYGEEYEERYSELIVWTFEEFRKKFAPGRSVKTRTDATGSSLEFERIDSEVSYFEWVLSDRPDHVFEMKVSPENRKAKKRDRVGFLLRKDAKRYEIRPLGTQVTRIKGSPVLYASPLEDIPLREKNDCENPDVSKPFFPTESLLVGVGETSRMEIRVPPRDDQAEEFREITLRAGEETMVEYAEVCLTRGRVQRIAAQELKKIEPRENLYLPEGARFELGQNEAVEILLFDGTEVVLNENESYTIHYFDSEEKAVDFFRYLPHGNYYGEFRGLKKDGESFTLPSFLHDPQITDDTFAPEVNIIGGTIIDATVFQPVKIDATGSMDNQNITRVWWDLHPEKDSDGDGNPENDEDFPSFDEKNTYFARDLLEVSLPPYEDTGTFFVVLLVKDSAGNLTSQKIEIRVSAPNLEIQEVSVRSSALEGKVANGTSGIPISLERNRNGEWENVGREEKILSGDKGFFRVESLRTSGGVEILDPAGKVVVEILENGRPIILDDVFDAVVESATKDHPVQIRIRGEQKETIAILLLEIKNEEGVIFDEGKLQFSEGVHILDREEKDTIELRKFPEGVALVDAERSMTLGVVHEKGDFISSLLSLRLKSTEDQNAPLVFEIIDETGEVRAELFWGFGMSGVQLQKERSFLPNVQKNESPLLNNSVDIQPEKSDNFPRLDTLLHENKESGSSGSGLGNSVSPGDKSPAKGNAADF